MATGTLSKKRRVINYLSAGRGLTANEARARFGVQNLRATMSDIRREVESYGNWEVISEETATGKTRYFMVDTHPGKRTYGYRKDGTRYRI
jgi:hypothetical protein